MDKLDNNYDDYINCSSAGNKLIFDHNHKKNTLSSKRVISIHDDFYEDENHTLLHKKNKSSRPFFLDLTKDNYYPHYDIKTKNIYVKDNDEHHIEDHAVIQISVAGFSVKDLSIKLDAGNLIVCGYKQQENHTNGWVYVTRGIAKRSFKRDFKLADNIIIKEAISSRGILYIYLYRVTKHVNEVNIPITEK